MIESLKIQIEDTKAIIKQQAYENNFISNDTEIILKNQLIIMKTLLQLLTK